MHMESYLFLARYSFRKAHFGLESRQVCQIRQNELDELHHHISPAVVNAL